MSKDNRDMSIEKEFNEAIEKLAPGESYSFDTYGFIFEAGYLLAQKEMQEKLDAANTVLKQILSVSKKDYDGRDFPDVFTLIEDYFDKWGSK